MQNVVCIYSANFWDTTLENGKRLRGEAENVRVSTSPPAQAELGQGTLYDCFRIPITSVPKIPHPALTLHSSFLTL